MHFDPLDLLIDGKFRPASDGQTQSVVNPATGETLGHVPLATDQDLADAIAAAAKGFEVWKRKTALERYDIMCKAADLIEARTEDIASHLTLENGKIIAEARIEVQFAADSTRWFAEEGRRAYGRVIPARLPNIRQMALKEPIGPVAAFAAWNFPATNVIRKVAASLAAGCSIVIKPSEETPATALGLARCYQDAGLPDGVLNMVFGQPDHVSETLLASPVFKKLSLTGSTAVGKLLLRRAAETIKASTMELGGHAPVIVYADADITHAVTSTTAAKYRNAGQVCTSPTRYFLHASVHDAFVESYVAKSADLVVGDGLDPQTHVGPMIANRRVEALESLVKDAMDKGATLALGGHKLDRAGSFFAPTVLTHVPDDARIMSEEPFGPITVIQSFTDFDDVIRRANALPYGLASYCFTQSSNLATKTEHALDAGMVAVNHMVVATPETPFGGVDQSGFGSESGMEGLHAYQRTKLVTEYVL